MSAKNEVVHMPKDSIVIVLDFPITSGEGEVINSLKMRRLKVRDMRRAISQTKGSFDAEVAVLAISTGLMIEDFDELDFSDYQKLQEAYETMGKSQASKK